MSVLKLKTQGQVLIIERPVPLITSGNLNNDEMRVTFDDTWDCDNGKLYASFYIDKPENALNVELEPKGDRSYSCLIPNEMVKKEGIFNVGVWCETSEKRKTSDTKKIMVYQGAATDGILGSPGEETPSFTEYARKKDIPTKLSQLEIDIELESSSDVPRSGILVGDELIFCYTEEPTVYPGCKLFSIDLSEVVSGGKVEIDSTLSQEGMVADAKATGDRLDAIEESLSNASSESWYERNVEQWA